MGRRSLLDRTHGRAPAATNRRPIGDAAMIDSCSNAWNAASMAVVTPARARTAMAGRVRAGSTRWPAGGQRRQHRRRLRARLDCRVPRPGRRAATSSCRCRRIRARSTSRFSRSRSVEYRVTAGRRARTTPSAIEPTGRVADHPFYAGVAAAGNTPGWSCFRPDRRDAQGGPARSVALLAKYEKPRQRYRTLVFLLLDHIGGVNTLFYTLSNGGTVVVSKNRSPAAVCDAIERHARRAAADVADVPESAAAVGRSGRAGSQLAQAHHLRHRADAGEHAGTRLPGVAATRGFCRPTA